MPRVDRDRRLDLVDVIAELLVAFEHPDDWPADHRCTKTSATVAAVDWQGWPVADDQGYDPALGYAVPVLLRHTACSHGGGRSLMSRLEELVPPGQRAAQQNPGKAPRGPKGSPAPWAAQPAELLDEIRRGAIDLHDSARRVLGLKRDDGYVGLDLAQRAARALTALPSDLLMIEGRGMTAHWLVAAECPGRPRCTVRGDHRHPGSIEGAVRSWHGRALLVTGHEQKRAKVGQVLNPLHPENTERYYRGPVHPRPPHGACDVHESCELMRQDRLNRYQQARCPWCDSVSLEQDPETGHVECVRPSCRDEQGHRHMWTVDELAHLGLLIVTEQES